MLLIIILVAVALGAIALALWAFRGTSLQNGSVGELESRLHEVDLPAFLNLTDPEEARFLARSLTPKAFRRVQRRRISATLSYLNALAANAALLIAMGELAGHSDDPEVAESGRRLANTAMRTRLLVIRSYFYFVPQWFFPTAKQEWNGAVVTHYGELKRCLVHLVSVQNPSMTSRTVSLM
ncbi:MAG: hypothetical protein ROO76_04605 [Terriglobia bacterium]|jgi:hypothetical protein|nr:hypothetical protein [Terriglobia bacterium]